MTYWKDRGDDIDATYMATGVTNAEAIKIPSGFVFEARGDRQMVFKGDCASCHADLAKGKLGQELYVAACGICHDAIPRASMVPNLHALSHPSDRNFWKLIITNGKPGTLMPAFPVAQGGPLTELQIESLVTFLAETIPADARLEGGNGGDTNAVIPAKN